MNGQASIVEYLRSELDRARTDLVAAMVEAKMAKQEKPSEQLLYTIRNLRRDIEKKEIECLDLKNEIASLKRSVTGLKSANKRLSSKPPAPSADLSKLYTVHHVARYLRVSEQTIRKWIASGELESVGELRNRRIGITHVQKVLESGLVPGPARGPYELELSSLRIGDLLDSKQFAKELGVSRIRVFAMVKGREVTHFKFGARLLFEAQGAGIVRIGGRG